MALATARQVAFITRLADERVTDAIVTPNDERLMDVLGGKDVTTREASSLIDALLNAPRVVVAPVVVAPRVVADADVALAPGIYVLPDATIVKVQQNKPKTRTYAKVWREINAERALIAGGRVRGEWDYAPGMIAHVRASHAMTAEAACAFGIRYGVCVRCGRALKAAESVERAIGPVCMKAFRAA